MNELNVILDAWRQVASSNQSAVLATVVHVKGSAYRRPGARMLILPDGRRIGSISGGCLEGDVSKKAWWFTRDSRPSVRVYDTSSGEDAVWEFGLGCDGVIHLLLERVDTPATRETLDFLYRSNLSRQPAVVATIIRTGQAAPLQAGDRLLVSPSGVAGGALAASGCRGGLEPHIEQTFRQKKSRLVHLHDLEVFVEWVGPPVPLIIFGAGHDAVPMTAMAKQLGWHVTVADGRPTYATAARFPDADRVLVMKPCDPLAQIEITRESVVVLMTHNYPQDSRLLREILAARPRYLGILGPKKRAERLLAEIGVCPSSFDLHAPVGLDIGADTPEAIALSIVAEIQAELAGRPGMRLRHRRASIHDAVEEVGEPGGIESPQPDSASCELSEHWS